jgi:hypothetical protein
LLGYAPTANVTHSRAPAIGELTLAGKQPSAAGASPTISLDTAQLGLSGAAPRRDESRSIAIPLGELFLITWRGLNLRGITPTFSIDSLGSDITIPGTELLPYEGTLAGQAPTANVTHSAAPAASDLTLAGKQPVALTSVTMEPAAGSVTLAGQQPTLDASSPIVAPNEATLLLQGTISQPVTQPPITVTPSSVRLRSVLRACCCGRTNRPSTRPALPVRSNSRAAAH